MSLLTQMRTFMPRQMLRGDNSRPRASHVMATVLLLGFLIPAGALAQRVALLWFELRLLPLSVAVGEMDGAHPQWARVYDLRPGIDRRLPGHRTTRSEVRPTGNAQLAGQGITCCTW